MPLCCCPEAEPAAKQEWLSALSWWCEGGERVRAVEALYYAYCAAMRERTCLEYAQQDEGREGGQPAASEQGDVGAEAPQQQQGHRTWRKWGQGIRRRLADRHRGMGGRVEDEAAAAVGPAQATAAILERQAGGAAGGAGLWPSAAAGPAAAAGMAGSQATGHQLESLDKILEARWMQVGRKFTWWEAPHPPVLPAVTC